MLSNFVLRLRRAETPFYARLKRIATAVCYLHIPVPGFLHPVCRIVYRLHWGVWFLVRRLIASFYVTPIFRGRCESSGRGLSVWLMPHVIGHSRIYIGDQLTIYGKVGISSGRVFDEPTLRIGNHVVIGHQVRFVVNKEIVIEDQVNIAGGCTIADNDGHPLNADLRAQNLPPSKDDIKPVRICRNAWLAEGCQIRKGVTIGECAIIGANSVVFTNIPPNCIAIGNPAKVVGFASSTGTAAVGGANVADFRREH
jgi:acetyltransferase-like isoleucine patch superfamily enzyme